MKRSRVGLAQIVDWHRLTAAYQRAARSAGDSSAVACFAADLNGQLALMRKEILEESIQVGQMTAFRIRDPKPRLIHAPCFRERVLHHAVMAVVGPVLERALVDDTYACRPGRGTLAAVKRCQQHLRRFAWYAQIDIRHYFASIDHGVLFGLLQRKFKDEGLLRLLQRIIQAFQTEAGKGLPIGALTSQHFANYYLAGLDRLRERRRRCNLVVGRRSKAGGKRVIRGGSWNDNARNVRCANRNANEPGNRNDNLGFRCARAHDRVGWPEPEQIDSQVRPWCLTKPNGPRCVSSLRRMSGESSPVGRLFIER